MIVVWVLPVVLLNPNSALPTQAASADPARAMPTARASAREVLFITFLLSSKMPSMRPLHLPVAQDVRRLSLATTQIHRVSFLVQPRHIAPHRLLRVVSRRQRRELLGRVPPLHGQQQPARTQPRPRRQRK